MLNPFRHFLEVVFLEGSGLGELWPRYLYLATIAAAVVALAARLFRRSVEGG